MRPIAAGLFFLFAGLRAASCAGADLEEIVRRGTEAIRSDWAADPDYAWVERDEVQKNGQATSKTSQVVTIADSDYYLPMAVNNQPLTADRARIEREKLKDEVRRRNAEIPSARRQRIAAYKKERDENGALLMELPNVFTFGLLREETINGYPAYALSAKAKKRTGPLSRAAKVLGGMRGTVWVDRDNFHLIRAECEVVTPVSLYGMLARVLPGTQIEIEMTPVNSSTWLIAGISMRLALAKFFWFKSTEVTRSSYSDYRPNAAVMDELLGEGGGHEVAPSAGR